MPSVSYIQSVLKKKCLKHPLFFCNMISIDPSSSQHRLCFFCMKEQNISANQVIPIETLLNMDPSTEFIIAPANEDCEKLLEKDKDLETISNLIDDYFWSLKVKVEKQIYQKFRQEKEKIQSLINFREKSSSSLKSLLQVKQIQKLLLSSNPNSESELHEYITQYQSQSEKEIEDIKSRHDEIDAIKNSISLDKLDQIESKLLSFIQSINLQNSNSSIFSLPSSSNEKGESILQCFPSEYFLDSKRYLLINKANNKIQITNRSVGSKQCYLNIALNPKQRYIIKLQLNNKSNNFPLFGFGLLNPNKKDVQPLAVDAISYFQKNGGHSQTIVKGSYLHSGSKKSIGVKNLEFRIHIENQMWMISEFPEYENVVSLTDPSVINISAEQFFAIMIGNYFDQVQVEEFIEVTQFDNKME